MDDSRKNFDFWYAAANVEILLAPERKLETFGSTLINYHLVSELLDESGRVRVREGRLEAARPTLIMPSDYAKIDTLEESISFKCRFSNLGDHKTFDT